MVNHQKLAINAESGQAETRKPGGDFASFQESFELVASRWKSKIDTADFDGVGIKLQCDKNSFGITDRSIKTRMLWWDEQIGEDKWGNPVYEQRTVWDWDWATVHLLDSSLQQQVPRLHLPVVLLPLPHQPYKTSQV